MAYRVLYSVRHIIYLLSDFEDIGLDCLFSHSLSFLFDVFFLALIWKMQSDFGGHTQFLSYKNNAIDRP